MLIKRRAFAAAAIAAAALPSRRTRASKPDLRVGIMKATFSGALPMVCVRQAVQEFTAGNNLTVEVLEADHQNKVDIAVGIARQWIDQDHVDAIIDVPLTPPALAVNAVCREKNKVLLLSDVGTADVTGKQCSPTTVHWTYDTYMLAKSEGGALVKEGGDTWFFIFPDYLFGQQLMGDASHFVTEAGGKVLGSAKHPLLAKADFAGVVQQAADSGAKVLGLCNFVDDAASTMKEVHARGLHKKMRIAGLILNVDEVHDIGLELTQGVVLTQTFYWDLNQRTREFTNRILVKAPNQYPSPQQAGNYAAMLHYLKAVSDMGVAQAKVDGAAVVARMKKLPTDDDCFGRGYIREDGRKMHPSYLFQVKTPPESKGEWDLLKLLGTTPAEQAFRPLNEGGCPLVRT
jgi:branched-chain amino acid transport system substrate-binding protein